MANYTLNLRIWKQSGSSLSVPYPINRKNKGREGWLVSSPRPPGLPELKHQRSVALAT
jgi:hypothetical protein